MVNFEVAKNIRALFQILTDSDGIDPHNLKHHLIFLIQETRGNASTDQLTYLNTNMPHEGNHQGLHPGYDPCDDMKSVV